MHVYEGSAGGGNCALTLVADGGVDDGAEQSRPPQRRQEIRAGASHEVSRHIVRAGRPFPQNDGAFSGERADGLQRRDDPLRDAGEEQGRGAYHHGGLVGADLVPDAAGNEDRDDDGEDEVHDDQVDAAEVLHHAALKQHRELAAPGLEREGRGAELRQGGAHLEVDGDVHVLVLGLLVPRGGLRADKKTRNDGWVGE